MTEDAPRTIERAKIWEVLLARVLRLYVAREDGVERVKERCANE